MEGPITPGGALGMLQSEAHLPCKLFSEDTQQTHRRADRQTCWGIARLLHFWASEASLRHTTYLHVSFAVVAVLAETWANDLLSLDRDSCS